MRSVFSRIFCAFALSASLVAPIAASAAATDAPADEYFGRYHLSVLGIRNSLNDVLGQASGKGTCGILHLVEDSLRDWQAHYPRDTWIPGQLLALERVYVRIGGPEGAAGAKSTAAWITKSYPRSQVSIQAASELSGAPVSDDGAVLAANAPASFGVIPGIVDTLSPPMVDSPVNQ